MKKAVVRVAGKQYVVAEGDAILVDLLPADVKDLKLETLLLIDGDDIRVGQPVLSDVTVSAKLVDDIVKGEKIRVIRYESKKRVHKENGHRQKYSRIEIVSIK